MPSRARHSPDIPSSHCNDFCGDDNNHKIHSSDSKGHLFDRDNEMNNSEKLNSKNDSNNNNNQQQNELVDMNEKDEQDGGGVEQREREVEGSPSLNRLSERSLSPSNGNSDEILKFKQEESKATTSDNANCFSHLLNSIMNIRRDETTSQPPPTTFNLNNFISGASNSSPIPNVPANNLLMNDLNRNFFIPNFPPSSVDSINAAGLEHLAMSQQLSKFGQGTCKFPGCNMIFDDLQNFTK